MRYRFSAVGILLSSIAGMAHAQAVPSTSEPGRIDERFQVPQAPTSVPDKVQIPDPAFGAPDQAAKTHFVLEGVEVDGATVFSAADFSALYAPMLHKDVTLADIYRVRDQITAKYRSQGYILSQALIPPQSITGGVVHVQIVEGSIGKVSVEGTAANEPMVRASMGGITASRPLQVHDLERRALLVGDIPGLTVHTTLKPSDTPGQADLIVSAERKRFDFTVFADNRGSRAIGPFEFGTSMTVNGLTGPDSLSLLYASASPTSELRYLAGHYQRVLAPSGLKLNLSVSENTGNKRGHSSAGSTGIKRGQSC